MTAPAVVDGIARLLAGAGVGAYDPDAVLPVDQVPITVGAMPASDGAAVVVATYPGGPPPDSSNGWEYPRLQVRVRHVNPLEALALDRACYEVLQEAEAELAGWQLTDCYALQSEAQPLGVDGNGRHEYARNYQLSVEPL